VACPELLSSVLSQVGEDKGIERPKNMGPLYDGNIGPLYEDSVQLRQLGCIVEPKRDSLKREILVHRQTVQRFPA
jgi:hypothetical protein